MPDNELFEWWLPEVDDSLAQDLGRFMIYWGHLEAKLDTLFAPVFRMNPTQATCVTANLGIKAKLDILRSGINSIATLLDSYIVEEVNEVFVDIADLSSKKRNLAAHGQPISLDFSDGDTPGWMLTRFAARKNITMRVYKKDDDFWRVACGVVIIYAESLNTLAREIHQATTDVSEADFDQAVQLEAIFE